MKIKSFSVSIIFAAAGIFLLFAAEPKSFHQNLWTLQGGVFFADHPGGDFLFHCTASRPGYKITEKTRANSVPAILITIYTPDEHVYKDFYWQDDNNELKKSFSCRIPNAAKGIWQIRVSQDEKSHFTYKFDLAPGKIDAVMPARCWIWHQAGKMFDKSYVMIPKNLKNDLRVTVFNCTIEFIDSSGKSTGKLEKNASLKLKTGEIYQYRNTPRVERWNWSGYSGYPVIFCHTAEFAKKLNASQIELADERIVPLSVQKRILDWKKTLKKEDFAVPEVDLQKYKAQMVADPESRGLLGNTGLLSVAPFLLHMQDVDPASPTFGAAKGDISGTRGDLGGLAYLYALNKPYNPYYKCRGLLNRVALYYLDFQVNHAHRALKENGTMYETSSNYAGADGMLQVPESTAFYLLARDLTPDVREMWSETLGYPARRFFSDRVSCENQSGHWPAKLYLYGMATGNHVFVKMAENFIRNLNNTRRDRFIRTGYLQEAYGPDATYQGLDSCLLAYYTMFSKDPEGYQLVDRINNFFNHTVAPEPDGGKIIGVSGFSHRTPGGWQVRQYGGGTCLVADKLESAACWHQGPSKNAAWNESEVQRLLDWAADRKIDYYRKNPEMAYSYSFMPYAKVWHQCPGIKPIPNSVLPVMKSDNFEHVFSDEFYFFRRPTYYTGAYAGMTAGTASSWANCGKPFPGKWSAKDGLMVAGSGAVFGAIQGPQLFWTPDFGMLLVCMNWNLYTRWNAWLTDGTNPDWPSYSTGKAQYDAAKKELTLTNTFRQYSCTIERKLQFGDMALTVSLKFAGNAAGKKLVEQLPFLSKDGVTVSYCVNGRWQDKPGEGVAAIRWKRSANAAVAVKFSRPVTVRKGITSQNRGMTVESLEIEIGTIGPDGFSYTVSSDK